MSKPTEVTNIAAQLSDPMPSAPPSYDDAMHMKQPPYNPQVMSQAPVGAVPQHPQPVPVVSAVAPRQQAIVPIQVGPRPATLNCPHCHQRVRTVTTTDTLNTAPIDIAPIDIAPIDIDEGWAEALCLIGCCLFCSCILCFMDSFNSVHHKCPKCGGFIGTYKY